MKRADPTWAATWLAVVLALLWNAGLAGCGDDDGEHAIDDARSGFADADIDALSACCEIEEPTCDCFHIGGTRNPNEDVPAFQCTAICDAEPDGWVQDVDENGCPILRWVGGTGSCIPMIDAGDDASADAGGEDGAPADAP